TPRMASPHIRRASCDMPPSAKRSTIVDDLPNEPAGGCGGFLGRTPTATGRRAPRRATIVRLGPGRRTGRLRVDSRRFVVRRGARSGVPRGTVARGDDEEGRGAPAPP